MNKKDIAHIRKQFKLDHDLLKIFDILNVYIMKESSEIYYYESQPFEMLERDQQELYMINFKKMLTGELGQKLFDLKFHREEVENHSQQILHQGLLAEHSEEWKEQMLLIVEKILDDTQYSHDTVLTFIRGEYFKPAKDRSAEAEESERDVVYTHPFILCSINKTEPSPTSLMFDYVQKQFNCHVGVDPIIKLSSPEAGFFFPTIVDQAADVNHVLYFSGRAHEPDPFFVEDVLNADKTVTAQEEKIIFEEIVREVAGDQLDTATLAHVYEEINHVIVENEEDEIPQLDYKDVGRVLKASGVEDVSPERVERVFQDVIDDQSYSFKASNIIPKYTSKSIKIDTKVATISISPQDLRYVKQVNFQGRRCLMIELDEDTVIEGFTMHSESL